MGFEIDIDFSLFKLNKSYFDQNSTIHGINHTYRVMCLVLYIGHAASLNRDVLLALCAAYIHDFARKHDGFCDQHGLWSAQHKLPEFVPFFKAMGIDEKEIKKISVAVRYHSESIEFAVDHKSYNVVSLLKDADALDRIRLGEDNLDIGFLRFREESAGLITFAKQLYFNTQNIKISSFVEIMKIAELINQ